MKLKAVIEIGKSFDGKTRRCSKDYEVGDFKEFFATEGVYLDTLGKAVEEHAEVGEGFIVTYTVNLVREA